MLARPPRPGLQSWGSSLRKVSADKAASRPGFAAPALALSPVLSPPQRARLGAVHGAVASPRNEFPRWNKFTKELSLKRFSSHRLPTSF